jgi:uncharacterized repeat protein (TIGR03943 family)
MSRRLPATFLLPPLVLATWGGFFLFIALSGKLRILLNPLFWPLEETCALVLIVLSILHLVLFRPVPNEDGTRIRGQLFWKAALLIVPLAIGTVFAPPSLSASALEARAALAGGKVMAQAGSNTSPGGDLALVDFAAAAYYPEQIPKVTGRKVRYLGQYLPGQPGQFRFCRVLMSCCAADATPIYLRVMGQAPDTKELQWIHVEGETFFTQEDGEWIACLHLTRVTPAEPPPDPYLYAMRMKRYPTP